MTSEDLVRRLYAALGAGDADAIDALLHPEFVGRVTDGLLDVGGVHVGRRAMRDEVWWRLGAQFRKLRPEPEQFRALADGGLLVLGRYRGAGRRSGADLDAVFAHVFGFTDGRIASIDQVTDSQRFREALGDPDAPVTYRFADGVGHLRLARPERRNAIDEAFVAAFGSAVDRCVRQSELRALLISADGPSFTVGGDADLFAGTASEELPDLLQRMTGPYHDALLRLANLEVPVVCAVQGGAGGGGLGLLYVADIVLIADGSRLALGFGALGVTGDGGASWFLPRLVGPRRAAELYFENRALTAAEAVEWGLATRVLPPETLAAEAAALTARLAAGPTRALGEIRQLLRVSWGNSLADQYAAETRAIGRSGATADAAEGFRAFTDKRTSDFKGH